MSFDNNCNGGLSAADVAVLTRGGYGGYGGLNGLGGNLDWLALFLLAGFGGWGGFGGMGMGGMWPFMMMPGMWNGGGGGCATQADVRSAVDQQTLISKIDGQTYGIADLGYAINSTLANGFSAGQMETMRGFHGVDNAVCTLGYQAQTLGNNIIGAVKDGTTQGLINTNAIQNQISSCCCDSQRQMERGFCDTQYRDQANTAAIMQNGHNDTDRIIAELRSMQTNDLQDKLAAANARAAKAENAADLCALKNAIVAELRQPAPIPAWEVPNPFTGRYGGNNGNGGGCRCGQYAYPA